jgi:ParB family transcriptional regulator, chromosome partitioning protein
MDLEHHQLDRRYEALRTRNAQRERRLLASLAGVGQQAPIVVVRDGDRWVVVDGYKRLRALQRLGHDVVRAAEWVLDELDAVVLERVMRSGDGDSAIEQGWLLRELAQRFRLGHDELARRFDRSTSWVSRRLGLVTDLPASVQEQVRGGAIGAHAAAKYLVPLARANATDCEGLAAALGGLHPTSRQVAELYAVYMGGSAAVRERVVQQPGLVLAARAELAKAGSDLTLAEHLLQDLRIVTSVARRAQRRLSDGALDGAGVDERVRAREQCHEAHFEIQRLVRRCDRETETAETQEKKSDAGSDDTDGHPSPA